MFIQNSEVDYDINCRAEKRHAYFDPTAHLCLNEKEKQQIENYVKKLVIDDVYPFDLQRADNPTASSSSTTFSSMSSITTTSRRQQLPTNTKPKPTAFDAFNAACGEEDITIVGSIKEKSRRIQINEELKYFKLLAQEFNLAVIPSAQSAVKFWKIHRHRLPLLTHLAKIHLIACATSVPSESAFSLSAFIARKERAHTVAKIWRIHCS